MPKAPGWRQISLLKQVAHLRLLRAIVNAVQAVDEPWNSSGFVRATDSSQIPSHPRDASISTLRTPKIHSLMSAPMSGTRSTREQNPSEPTLRPTPTLKARNIFPPLPVGCMKTRGRHMANPCRTSRERRSRPVNISQSMVDIQTMP